MEGITFSYRAKVITLCAMAAAVLIFLFTVREILQPFVWAMIVAYVFNPVVSGFTRRTRFHRFWGVALLYAVMAGVIAWIIIFVLPPLRRETMQFSRDFPQLIEDLYMHMVGKENLDLFGFQLHSDTVINGLIDAIQSLAASASDYVLPVFFGVLGVMAKILMFVFSLFYFLLEADKIGKYLHDLLPVRVRGEILGLCMEIDDVLGRWVRGQLTLVLVMSVATWVGLTLLGLRYALVLAMITGVLEIFPLVGPFIAGAIATVVAVFQPNPFGWTMLTYVLAVIALYFVLRHAEDYLVIPNIIGRIVEFHPLAVIFALFAGGSIAGILGMFIAAPTLAVLKVLMRYLYGKLVEAPAVNGGQPAPEAPAISVRPAQVTQDQPQVQEAGS